MQRLITLVLVVSGKVLAQGSLLACGLIAARVAGPHEFALYSAALTLVLLLDACLGSPLDYAVVTFSAACGRDPERVNRMQAGVFRVKLAIGAVLIAVALCFGERIAGVLLQDESRAPLIWIAALCTASLLLTRSMAASLQAHLRFRAYFSLDAAQGAVRALLVGVLAICGFRYAGWYLASFGTASAVLLALALRLAPQAFLSARWPTKADAASITRFITVTTGVIVLGTITGRTDLLFLSSAHAEGLALYAGATQLASIATLLAGYASIAIQPRLIPMLREGRLGILLAEGTVAALVVATAMLLVVWRFGGAIVSGAFGHGFAGAGGLLLILTLGTCADLLGMPVAMTFVLQTRPRQAFWAELVFAAIYFAGAAHVAAAGVEQMAWLVTALRFAKAAFYLGTTLRELRRQHLSPAMTTAF